MNLNNKIKENIIKPYLDSIFTTVKASVTSFDSYRNRASIEYDNPKGQGKISKEKVPIQISMPGVYSSSIEEGDFVWVAFENGSPLRPKIVGILDEKYEINTREKIKHIRQGGLVTNEYQKKEYIKKPRINSWVSNKKLGYAKQINYVNFDIEGKYLDIASNLGYYKEKELGFTHTVNGTTIKVTNDGSIQLFTSINNGISINTTDNSIDITSLKELSLKSPKINIKADDLNLSIKNLKLNGNDVKDGFFNK